MSPLIYLERLIRHGKAPEEPPPQGHGTWGLGHAVSRLSDALSRSEFKLDHAILLRQCLRLLEPHQKIVVDAVAPSIEQHFRVVGIHRTIDGQVISPPYVPDWLRGSALLGVDVPAKASLQDDEPIAGETWLQTRVGKTHWRSQAQREASWEALTAPPNSTLLVGLPTGAGKSLVYQVCAAFEVGLTVVVVPTVALGLDQIKALANSPLAQSHNPRLYTSDAHASDVLESVKSRYCRLLVTSPEAIVFGKLHDVLSTMAEEGWLARFVIDEAHIVDSWGASFRVEFQLLTARLREWRSASPTGLKTLLLSATFGPGTTHILRGLFADTYAPWNEYIIQRLRPEIHYFSPCTAMDEQSQVNAVTEALLRLPRPAILYLTERNHAVEWFKRLRQIGLRRIECFHGETRPAERTRILDAWRADQIDLVVATSAFGMGVDKPDVRAVVHACFPENIDRYYQEVGRGGRDGAPSTAIAIWTRKDRNTGGGMGPRLLSDGQKIRERWAAMWHESKPSLDPGLRQLPLRASPNYKLHERTYGESITWNKRLLLMMERANILRIESLASERDPVVSEEFHEWASVRMLRSTVLLEEQLPDLLATCRSEELAHLKVGRRRLDELLSSRVPACRLLRDHYGRSTRRTCGSCEHCRAEPEARAGLAPMVLHLNRPATTPLVDIVYGPSTTSTRDQGQIILALRRAVQDGLVSRFFAMSSFALKVKALLEEAASLSNTPYRLDPLQADTAQAVRSDEAVICLHDQVLSGHATLLHSHGSLCAHWILGGQREASSNTWPFLHDYQSRLFSGPQALNEWIDTRRKGQEMKTGPQDVH
jgi:ATP-dependent DNA helicase RecQ